MTDRKFQIDHENDFLIINLNKKCEQNQNYTLDIAYSGVILEDIVGLFKNTYLDTNGSKH